MPSEEADRERADASASADGDRSLAGPAVARRVEISPALKFPAKNWDSKSRCRAESPGGSFRAISKTYPWPVRGTR